MDPGFLIARSYLVGEGGGVIPTFALPKNSMKFTGRVLWGTNTNFPTQVLRFGLCDIVDVCVREA